MEYRNLTPLLRRGLLIGSLALLVVIGMIALTNKTAPSPVAATSNGTLVGNPEPVSRDLGYTDSNPRVISAVSPFQPSEPPPAPAPAFRQPVPMAAQMAPMEQAPIVETAARSRRTVSRRYYYRSRVRRRRGRPFSHSVAIVGGSAAGGAIVGGLVGGGKGAGIGALAGGAGGLIYDRATHKHPR